MVYEGHHRNKNCNFDYIGLGENKICQISDLKKILEGQCDIIIENDLNRCIDSIAKHWNETYETVSKNVTGAANSNTNSNKIVNTKSKMYESDIVEYQSRVYDVREVLHQLLVQYEEFSKIHLPNVMREKQPKDIVVTVFLSKNKRFLCF